MTNDDMDTLNAEDLIMKANSLKPYAVLPNGEERRVMFYLLNGIPHAFASGGPLVKVTWRDVKVAAGVGPVKGRWAYYGAC